MRIDRTATTVAIAALAASAVLTATATSHAKQTSRGGDGFKVTEVTGSPTSVSPGGTLSVEGEVRNTGRRDGRARIRVYLTSRRDTAKIGSTSVRVGAGKSKDFSLRGSVPRSLDRGTYRLLACTGKRDRRGKGRGGSGCRSGNEIEVVARDYAPGARSLGDPLFPQIGNGGYDARSYDLDSTTTRWPNDVRVGDDDDEGDRDPGPLGVQPGLPGHGRLGRTRER